MDPRAGLDVVGTQKLEFPSGFDFLFVLFIYFRLL
jgi:hypothetical protein